MDETSEVVTEVTVSEETTVEMPVRHQLGKLVFSSVVGFGASKVADGVYDKLLAAWRQRRAG